MLPVEIAEKILGSLGKPHNGSEVDDFTAG